MNDDFNSLDLELFEPLIAREAERVRRNVARAQEAKVSADLTLLEWFMVLSFFKFRCAFCKAPYETMEHLLPLSAGGGTTVLNCVPCCEACNQLNNQIWHRLEQTRCKLLRLNAV